MTKSTEAKEVEEKTVTSVRVTTATMERVSVLQQITRDGRKKRTYDTIISDLVTTELQKIVKEDEKAATVVAAILDDSAEILGE